MPRDLAADRRLCEAVVGMNCELDPEAQRRDWEPRDTGGFLRVNGRYITSLTCDEAAFFASGAAIVGDAHRRLAWIEQELLDSATYDYPPSIAQLGRMYAVASGRADVPGEDTP